MEAMKILLPDLEADPEAAERFIREIQILAALHHPNIAALQTAQRINNQLIMIMELVQGVTLKEVIRAGPVPLQEGMSSLRQMLLALSYAHQRDIIHRDVKPGNIMITPEGAVKLDCHVCAPKGHFPAVLSITFTHLCGDSTLRYLCSASRSLTLRNEATFPS